MRELDDDGTRAVVTIQRLQAAYGDAVTRRDWPAVRALFEPHAQVRLDLRRHEPIVLDGPDALVDFVDQALRPFAFFVFTILNATTDVDGDEGAGLVYLREVRRDHEGRWSEAYGLYRDAYHRRDGTWRIAARSYRSMGRRGPDGDAVFPLGDAAPGEVT